MAVENSGEILKKAEKGIANFLKTSRDAGRIDDQLYQIALNNTFKKLKLWLEDPNIDIISPLLKKGIIDTINSGDWEKVVNAFRQNVRFGTGGIRGMMAFDRESIRRMKDGRDGIGSAVFKGPNTINDLVMLMTTAGVAQFGRAQKPVLEKVVVGYDSRVRGHDFARAVAEVFLGYGYTVYFFDAPCPYPEVTFAIPHEDVKADIGVLISASHNDYRYNGYKLSCANGSQFDPEERDEMYHDYIQKIEPKDIVGHICKFKDAGKDKLYFLGGDELLDDFDYSGKEMNLINMHRAHRRHMQSFLMTENLPEQQKKSKNPLNIAFCPFHGAGYKAVPRLLQNVGFLPENIKSIDGTSENMGLNELNGMFPAFCSDPGREQQPDPGDPRAARTAVKAFKLDYGEKAFKDVDILIGTDPDADRCGIVVKIPEKQRHIYSFNKEDYYLLPADDMWTLVVWYRLQREIERFGKIKDAEKKFIVLSHTTSDSITRLALKYGLGVVKTWVGFAALAAATRDTWDGKAREMAGLKNGHDEKYIELCHPFICETYGMTEGKRSINYAAMEQSNGFSILGGPPPDGRSLGVGGHVRDKDGTFAALLVAEIAAWAKEKGTDIIGLLDKDIYLDPDIGLFATFYEPDPLDGEYPGIEGDRIKKNILIKAYDLYDQALGGKLVIAGRKVKAAAVYRTGKYDEIYPPEKDFVFPDEGIRLFFEDDPARQEHITIRPSGTGNSLRFHIQLHDFARADNLNEAKNRLRNPKDGLGIRIMNELRERLDAPRR
ncbi:MAG: hypothetical protein CVT49_01655 [candidate division Zixibacteria bacterium HGW-Zixibacteria-1]|nr:MAG: hypothetical protein CVT49_01655 [candidate division Zixibacteria bacterium HGW-Zixibacteria-1]